MWFQKNKWKIIIPLLILAVLAAAFSLGGSAPEGKVVPTPAAATQASEEAVTPQTKTAPAPVETPAPAPEPTPAPEVTPAPVETTLPAEISSFPEERYCTISISCATVLDHVDQLDPAKVSLVPADGWILGAAEVRFRAGESVFDALQRVCKEHKIHMEFANTPAYNSAYIEGIGNLYEFDCGELSGWMYSVNGWFPNYGCSSYTLSDGDVICWVYTCDLGADVGSGNVIG